MDVFDFNWHLTSLYASPFIGNSNREASAGKKSNDEKKNTKTPIVIGDRIIPRVLAQQYYPPFFPSEKKKKKQKAVER